MYKYPTYNVQIPDLHCEEHLAVRPEQSGPSSDDILVQCKPVCHVHGPAVPFSRHDLWDKHTATFWCHWLTQNSLDSLNSLDQSVSCTSIYQHSHSLSDDSLGHYKTWTLDSGLDHGLDYGLDWTDQKQLYTDSKLHQSYNKLSPSMSQVAS